MKFKDLEIGARFQFIDLMNIHTKVGGDKYSVESGEICSCRDYVQVSIPDFDIKKFDELAIGAKFSFLDRLARLTKTGTYYYSYASGATLYCARDRECIAIFEPVKFEDLPVGARFRFPGFKREFIKTYSNCCVTTVKKVDAVVKRIKT